MEREKSSVVTPSVFKKRGKIQKLKNQTTKQYSKEKEKKQFLFISYNLLEFIVPVLRNGF